MTWRTRSPYSVLPDARRHVRVNPGGWSDAYALGGVEGLALVVEDALRSRVAGRASHPAEVRLLREWLDVATAEEVARWLSRHAEPVVEDLVADYLDPDEKTAEEVEEIRARVEANRLRRMAEGGVFRECPACSGWFVPLRARPAFDGLVYCSRRCIRRAGGS